LMKSGGVPGLPVHDEQDRPSVMIVLVVGCTDHLLTPREAVELRERVRAVRVTGIANVLWEVGPVEPCY
jgi:hypothetical protein